jgi:putative hemolysin
LKGHQVNYIGPIGVLICLAGGTLFFSVNTIALQTFSRAKLQDAFKAKKREHLADNLVENAEKFIFACSLYRLICNICLLLLLHTLITAAGLSSLNTYLLTFIIAIAFFSTFTVAVPHAWAKYAGEKILSRTYKLLTLSAAVLSPILHIFYLQKAIIRRLAGVSETTPAENKEERQEEFLTDLEQHRMEGVVDEEEQEMIESVLELSETTAGQIMTPRTDVTALNANDVLDKVLETIKTAGHSRVPVYEKNIDNIIGFIYAKDLLTEVGKTAQDFKLRDKMRGAYFVPETKPLRALLHEFQNQKLHIAVVLDEYGGTAGIVTIEDIIEELVGEITDEYEQIPPKPIKKIDKNTIDLDARTYINDLNDELELNLPEDEDYDTIGGFVFSHLGYIPKTAETFEYENLKFTIISAEARRIKRIRIQKSST